MQLLYLPVINPDTLRSREVRPMNWMDPRLRGSEAYHPHALVSFARWGRQRFRWEPEEFVFGDSAGYSVYSRGRRFNPRAVLRWQLRFCTLGAILDTPPGPPAPWRDFGACLEQTVADVQAALPIYQAALDRGSPFRWWGAVHGHSAEERERWWEAIRRVYAFEAPGEGWCCKPWPYNGPEAVAGALRFFRERGIRRMHIFGQSAPLAVETVICLGPRAGLELVTFDSASPIKWAYNGQLALPRRNGWRIARVDVREHMLACGCASCDMLRAELHEAAGRLDERCWTQRATFHNVLVMLAHFETLKRRYWQPGHPLVRAG